MIGSLLGSPDTESRYCECIAQSNWMCNTFIGVVARNVWATIFTPGPLGNQNYYWLLLCDWDVFHLVYGSLVKFRTHSMSPNTTYSVTTLFLQLQANVVQSSTGVFPVEGILLQGSSIHIADTRTSLVTLFENSWLSWLDEEIVLAEVYLFIDMHYEAIHPHNYFHNIINSITDTNAIIFIIIISSSSDGGGGGGVCGHRRHRLSSSSSSSSSSNSSDSSSCGGSSSNVIILSIITGFIIILTFILDTSRSTQYQSKQHKRLLFKLFTKLGTLYWTRKQTFNTLLHWFLSVIQLYLHVILTSKALRTWRGGFVLLQVDSCVLCVFAACERRIQWYKLCRVAIPAPPCPAPWRPHRNTRHQCSLCAALYRPQRKKTTPWLRFAPPRRGWQDSTG